MAKTNAKSKTFVNKKREIVIQHKSVSCRKATPRRMTRKCNVKKLDFMEVDPEEIALTESLLPPAPSFLGVSDGVKAPPPSPTCT
jgi:hypothetical protein